MAITLAELVLRLLADSDDFQSGIQGALGKAEAFGAKLAGIGSKLTLGITGPLVGAGVAAFKFASDAAESASKMEAVFGPATESVNAQLQALMQTIPSTSQQLQDMASGIQDLLVPLGMAPAAAEEMTLKVVKLAGDLASFNNIPVSEALERIRSGLVGQNEPLLKFGVALNAAQVEAKALELGLISEGDALDANARAQAAFQLILEGTTAAHGDAARTSDSAANSFKFFQQAAGELMITIGEQLLPVITPLIQRITEIIQRVSQADPTLIKWGITIAGVVAAVGPLLIGLGTLLSLAPQIAAAVTFMTGPWGIAITIAGALAIAIATHWDEITAFTASMRDKIVGFFTTLRDRVGDLITRMVAIIDEQIVQRFTRIIDAVKARIDAVVGFFKGMFEAVAGGSYVPEMVAVIDQEMVGHFGDVVSKTGQLTRQVEADYAAMSTSVQAQSETLLDKLKGTLVDDLQTRVVDLIGEKLGTVTGFFEKLDVDVTGFLAKFIDKFKEFLVDKFGEVIVNFVKIAQQVKDFLGDIGKFFDKIKAGSGQGFEFGVGGAPGGFFIDWGPLLRAYDITVKLDEARNVALGGIEAAILTTSDRTHALLAEIRDAVGGIGGGTAASSAGRGVRFQRRLAGVIT